MGAAAGAGVVVHTMRWLLPSVNCSISSSKLLSRTIHHHRFNWSSSSSLLLYAAAAGNPRRRRTRRLVCSLSNNDNDDGGDASSSSSNSSYSPFEDDADAMMMGYIGGQYKATQVAHQIWKRVVRKGDAVVDATCGNGYDTLAMLKMVSDESGTGRVFGMDIQENALETTMSLLEGSVKPSEKKLVKLFPICHSKMEEVVPSDVSVRLVAFNLGYLPGGDKTVITRSETTLLGLEAAARVLGLGGLITVVAYVGHPGGREEFERVQDFASGLPVDNWICCKLQMVNRPLAPILVFLFKKSN